MPRLSTILVAGLITLASRPAHSQSLFNPTVPAAGFNAFTKSAIQFTTGTIDGPVATAGDAILSGNVSISLNYSGFHPSGNGSPANYGLVIGGRVWYNSGGQTQVNRGQVRIGQLTGSSLYQLNTTQSQTQVLLTPGAQAATPNIFASGQNAVNAATTGNGLNFTTAFNAFQNYSSIINNFPLTHPTASSFNYFSMPRVTGGGTHFITVIPGKVNYITMTGAQFSAMNSSGIIYYFNKSLDSSTVVIFNITATGTVNWNPPSWGSINDNSMGDGRYILYNFPNASRINIGGSNPTIGNILAPGAAVYKTGSSNTTGTIIADTLAIQSGNIRYAPFGGELPGLSTALPLEQLALTGIQANDKVRLNWEAPLRSAGETLTLERSTDGNIYETRAELGSAASGWWSEQVPARNGAVFYRLRLTSPGSNTRVSAAWRAAATGLTTDVAIYPNPFVNSISLSGSGRMAWTVYTLSGLRIRSGACEGSCVISELANLSPGNYFIRTTSGDGTSVRQLFKQ